jgi:hypothetical protein
VTEWFLEVYNRTGDDLLVSEHPLAEVSTEQVRSILGQPPSEPMYDLFRLPDTHLEWAQRAAGVTLDASRFDYFLVGRFGGGCGPSGLPSRDANSRK